MKCHGCGRNYCGVDLPADTDPKLVKCFECWIDGLLSEPEIDAPDDGADDCEPTEAEWAWANADMGGEG